jgi:hypothetical protein
LGSDTTAGASRLKGDREPTEALYRPDAAPVNNKFRRAAGGLARCRKITAPHPDSTMNLPMAHDGAATLEPPRPRAAAQLQITPLASYITPEPPLPRTIGGRRLDIFQAYLARVRTFAATAPIKAYTVEVPALEVAYHLELKTLVGRTGDGKIITDLFGYSNGAAALFDTAAQPAWLAGRSLVAADGLGVNYYHFLFNSLVRLAVVMRTHPLEKFDHIIVADDSPPFVRQALEMLGVRPEQVVSLARTPRLRCERAWCGQYISDLIYPHRISAQLLRGLFPAGIHTGRRLYIVRQQARSVVNHDDVWNVLRPRGFEMVRCEQLSLLEQVRLFASAQAVVSPHGAALANIVFCPAGAKVIEFHSPRFVQSIYWFLAAAAGLEYAYLIGRGDDPPIADRNGPRGWRSGSADCIDVPADQLERLCADMGL